MLIGRNVMMIMYDKKISQKELAHAIGVSEMMVSKIVNGHKNPSVEKLVKIASVLGCTVDELLQDEKEVVS